MPGISIMIKPVSGLCNMRCSYCFYADEMARRDTSIFEAMDDATLEKVIRRAFSYADGEVSFVFQGGEPTLAGAPFYRRVLELERKYNSRGLRVFHAIQSNGLHMSDELIAVLREGGFLVGLSVDGTKEIHDARRVDAAGAGTYDRVMTTARRLREANVEYNILCVVDRAVSRQPQQVYDALAPHGFLQFIPCLDPLDGTQSESSLRAEDYGCFLIEIYRNYARALRSGKFVSVRAFDNWLTMLMGRSPENCGFAGCCAPNFLIEGNGNVYPCDFYALDEWLLGNINDTPFNRLVKSEKMRNFLESSRVVDEECRKCRYLRICRGGCRRDREPGLSGAPLKRNRLCAAYRMLFDACLSDMLDLAREVGRRASGDTSN